MKSHKDWKGNLDEYLQAGDEVDQDMVDYIAGCVPPLMFTSAMVQCGEPYSVNDMSVDTYCTFEKIDGKWIFKGYLPSLKIQKLFAKFSNEDTLKYKEICKKINTMYDELFSGKREETKEGFNTIVCNLSNERKLIREKYM